MGRRNDLILEAFQGKFLVKYDLTIDSNNNNRLNADLRIIKRDNKNRDDELDVRASIIEDRVLAKLYQIPSFGVKVPKEVDLRFARKLPTRLRLAYLNDKVEIRTIRDAHTAFAKYLDNDGTDVFFDKFNQKYDTEDSDGKTYYGFYAWNLKTRNIMFFREHTNYMHICD